MKLRTIIPMLGLTALLAACGQKSENNAPAASNSATAAPTEAMIPMSGNETGSMGNMAMSGSAAAATTAHGTGTVKAVDKAAGTITLDHGPIPEANWPAMTMAFKAAPALLDKAAVGDKVTFDLKLEGSSGEVTAIIKQ